MSQAMATIKLTFNGQAVSEATFGDALKDAILISAIGTVQAKILGALTPQEASLITLHFSGRSLESLSFAIEGPEVIARKALAATRGKHPLDLATH
jgi:hypothetical protein